MLDRRGVRRRHKAWIDVTETTIAGDHMRHAVLDTAEFTIPHHVAGAEILHRAPRRIAEAAGVARGRTKANRCRKSGGRQCRSEDDCHGAKFKPPRWRCKARRPIGGAGSQICASLAGTAVAPECRNASSEGRRARATARRPSDRTSFAPRGWIATRR